MRKLVVLGLLLLSACRADGNRTFIQGSWQPADAGSAASSQPFVLWQFSRGGFILQQEIRTGELMISQGSYSVLENEGNRLKVELYNISGDLFTYNNLPVVYVIDLDLDSGMIRINDRLFERIE